MGKRNRTTTGRSLQALGSASRQELNALFEAEFRHAPAPRASLELMRQNLSWAAQARVVGDHPRKRREQLIRKLNRRVNGKKPHSSLPYRPGTRLIREWHGTVYEVTVLENGFAFEGTVYPNLSKIATHITGTKWSRPRFFGLTERTANEK
jgi:hypothetical protein